MDVSLPFMTIILVAISSMSLLSCFFFFMMGYGRGGDKPALYFSALSLFLVFYMLSMVDGYTHSSINRQYFNLIIQGLLLPIFFILLHLFFDSLLQTRNLIMRKFIFLIYGFLFFYTIFTGSGYWFSEITEVKQGSYSWGEIYFYLDGKIAWTYYLSILIQYIFYPFYFYKFYKNWKKSRKNYNIILLTILFIFILTTTYDKFIDFGLFEGVYLSQYVLLLFFILMGIMFLIQEKQRLYRLSFLNRELSLSEKLNSSILDNLQESVILINNKSQIVMINPSGKKLLNINSSKDSFKLIDSLATIKSIIDESEIDFLNIFSSSMDGAIKDEKTGIFMVEAGLQIAKNVFPVIISASIIGDKKDKRYLFVIRDLTEEHSLKKRLNQSQKMEAVGRLAGGIAHDFNNMLGGIIGFSELLIHDTKGELKEYSQSIFDTAIQASSLTEKLLIFSRQEKVEHKPIELTSIVKGVVSILKRTVDKKIILVVDLDNHEFYCNGDNSQIFNAILNLSINAADSMLDGGKLTIKVSSAENNGSVYNVISVSDTGTGIPDFIVEHIYEPFFTSKEKGKGTGLGLAAVYTIVQEHSGFIDLKTEMEVGTQFSLFFPILSKLKIKEEKENILLKDKSSKKTIDNASGLVLVVDDEPVVRKMTKAQLEKIGYGVIVAENGEEALSLYKKNKKNIILIILDMVLPNMNGEQIYNELKKIDLQIPVLFSSGYDEGQSYSNIKSKMPIDFIKKPFTKAELSGKITNLLNLK